MNGRNSTSYIFYRLISWRVRVRVRVRGLSFEITKTTTPKLAVKFDLKLGGKDRTKDNLTVRPLPKAGVALWPFFLMSRHMLSHKYVTTFTPRKSWRSHVWDINDI